MSGYRRPAGGFYVTSVTSPAGGYGSTLGRYDLPPVPTPYTGGATRLVSSSGVPRRYQLYSRSDTPSGLTNYDVIRRGTADPLAARYRQNRHSWAAGGSLTRSPTVASVGDLQWRRGRRDSAEPAAPAPAPARSGELRGAEPQAAEAASEPAAVSQSSPADRPPPVIRIETAPAPPPSTGLDGAPAAEQTGSEAPVAPPRRTGKGRAASPAAGPARPTCDPRHAGVADPGEDRPPQTETGEVSDRHGAVKAEPLNEPASAAVNITGQDVLPLDPRDAQPRPAVVQGQLATDDAHSVEPAKVNPCQNGGELLRNTVSSSVQRTNVSKGEQVISTSPDLKETRQISKENADPSLKSDTCQDDKSESSSLPQNTNRNAFSKHSEAVPEEVVTGPVSAQPGNPCIPGEDCVKPAGVAPYQEPQLPSDGPVRPPRHIPAGVGSKAAAVTAPGPAGDSGNASNKPHVAAPTLAKSAGDQPSSGAVKTMNGGRAPELAARSLPAMEVPDSSSSCSEESEDSSTYTYSSSPETASTASELSDLQQTTVGISVNAPAKAAQKPADGFETVQLQEKEADESVSSSVNMKDKQKEKAESLSIMDILEADNEPIDFWRDPGTALGAETPRSPVRDSPTVGSYEPSSPITSSSGTSSSQNLESSYSESLPSDSPDLSSVEQKGSEKVTSAPQDVQLMASESEHQHQAQPKTGHAEHPPRVIMDKVDSSVSNWTRSDDHDQDISGSSVTAETSTSAESTASTSPESPESSSVAGVSSTGSPTDSTSGSEHSSSVSGDSSRSSPEPAPAPRDDTSASAAPETPQCRPQSTWTAAAPGPPDPAPGHVLSDAEHMKLDSESPVSTAPGNPAIHTPGGAEPHTPMDTTPESLTGTEPSLPTGARASPSPLDPATVLPAPPSNKLKSSLIIESLTPVLGIRPSSPDSDSSSVCSECSTSETETSSSGSDFTDSSETQSTIESEPDLGPVATRLHPEQKISKEVQHSPQAVETASSLSETAACPTAGQPPVATAAAAGDDWAAPTATIPDSPSPQPTPEAAVMEIPPPARAVTVTASPRSGPRPAVRLQSKALQPAAEVQQRPSPSVSITEPARPARAEETSSAVEPPAPPAPAATIEEEAAPAVVAPPRLRHRPPPAEGADVETPAMVARRQRRIRRTASSPEVGDRLVRLDGGGGERPAVPRSPPPNMTPLRRRIVLAQQTQKPRELMTPGDLDEQFMQVCVRLNESRFREVMLAAGRIATAATINQTDGSGRTALSHLCVHGNGRCVEEFSRLPYVDANLADKDGNTPLHHAAQAGHAAVVSALLENYTEIEVDAKNGKGITPLIKACVQGKSKCAKLLLAHGADPLIRDPSRGLSCVEWSYYCGRHACARLVEAYLLARDGSATAAPGGGGLKRVSSEPELAPPSGGQPGWFRAKFRRLLGRCSPPRQPPTPPRQRRPSLPTAGEEQRDRQAPPRPPVRLPDILVEEVEVAIDPVIVRYGDWVAPSQRPRQHNQMVNLCLPGTSEEFLYE